MTLDAGSKTFLRSYNEIQNSAKTTSTNKEHGQKKKLLCGCNFFFQCPRRPPFCHLLLGQNIQNRMYPM